MPIPNENRGIEGIVGGISLSSRNNGGSSNSSYSASASAGGKSNIDKSASPVGISKQANLTSVPTLVESPFIIIKIGNITFGAASKRKVVNSDGYVYKVQYPNFMQDLTVTKVDGKINSYKIKMVYAITPGDDPNMMDKILSGAGYTTAVTIQYGDWSSPMYIYKEEHCLIQQVSSEVDFASPKITYTISCLGTGYSATVNKKNYGSFTGKPSEKILALLKDKTSGLSDTFTGMRNLNTVITNSWVLTNDKSVYVPSPGETSSVLDYVNYLVKYMANDSGRESHYGIVVMDDPNNQFGGPYFKIVEYSGEDDVLLNAVDTYEVDVGYPGNAKVVSFKITDNQEYALLEKYANSVVVANNYTYRINTHGELVKAKSPFYERSDSLLTSTEADKNWFTRVSKYPITATLVLKGLIRPTVLMSYIKINTLFYGQKHNTSGTYVITRQVDRVDASGYKTTLDLLRVRGDVEAGYSDIQVTNITASPKSPNVSRVPIDTQIDNGGVTSGGNRSGFTGGGNTRSGFTGGGGTRSETRGGGIYTPMVK